MIEIDWAEIAARERTRGTLMELKQSVRTMHDLVLLVARYRYERGLLESKRAPIQLLGQRYGLLDQHGRAISKYFALLTDEVEKLVRELTGKTEQAPGLCKCGCGRMVRGKARTATQACRKRLSRKVTDVTVEPISTFASA